MNQFEDIIFKYYPKGVSYFSGKYEDTQEYNLFKEKVFGKGIYWENFIDSCIEEFGIQSIEDRSNNEPGNILILSRKHNKLNLIFIFYISKLVDKYCYHVKIIGDVANNFFPNFNNNSYIEWNKAPTEGQQVVSKILSLIGKYYPAYSAFENDLNVIVPDVSTLVHDLGESTIFNLLFSNYLF